jgi:sodium/bile acid cotransporter 7
LILLMLLKAAADVGSRLRDESLAVSAGGLLATALLCLLTHLLGLAGGFWSSRALGFDRASQIAVAFSCSQKTLPVAVFLFDAYFREYPLAVVPMLCYHVGQLVVDTFIADGLAHRAPAVADLPAEATV